MISNLNSDKENNAEELKSLGSNTKYDVETKYCPEKLESFSNKFPENDYVVKFVTSEFTSMCPKTHQPDYIDHLSIMYKPNKNLVESKSLKIYLMGFRNYGAFGENLTNTILNDIVTLLKPAWARVTLAMKSRGGLGWTTSADFIERTGTKVDEKGLVIDTLHV